MDFASILLCASNEKVLVNSCIERCPQRSARLLTAEMLRAVLSAKAAAFRRASEIKYEMRDVL